MQSVKKYFKSSRNAQLFALLSLLTLFDFALLAYRLDRINFDWSAIHSIQDLARMRGTPSFIFLVWNLFLAWIPYWVSLSLNSIKKGKVRRFQIVFTLGLWLLFFPNAPYILTDLLHFRDYGSVPVWYDLMLLLSFAFTGLMLGWLSLLEVQQFLKKHHSPWIARFLTFCALVLCSYGIYLGRFQRWNSWDILTNPLALFRDMLEVLSNPLVHADTLGIAVVLSGFLTIGYMILTVLIKRELK